MAKVRCWMQLIVFCFSRALCTELEKPLSILLVNGLYRGHLSPLVSLGEQLVKRGHGVTLIANVLKGSRTYPEFPESVGIKFISAGYDQFWTKDSFDKVNEDLAKLKVDGEKMRKIVLTSLLQIRKKAEEVGMDQFDMVVSDIGIHPIATYFHLLGKKSVVLNSLMTMDQPSLEWPVPLPSSGQSDNLSFLERFLNAVFLERLLLHMTRSLYYPIVDISDRYREVLTPHSDFLSYPGTKLPMIVASAQGFDYAKSRLYDASFISSIRQRSGTMAG